MTYHLARVLHWQQDRSVALYATSIERQLHLTPGGEYGILRLDLLSGGDRLDNLPQWLACLVAWSSGPDRAGWTWALAVGAAPGLATFTKATAYVFALPFLVLLAVCLLRNAGGVGRLAAVAALAGVVAVGLNAGQFARNQDLYGMPLGPDGEGARTRSST